MTRNSESNSLFSTETRLPEPVRRSVSTLVESCTVGELPRPEQLYAWQRSHRSFLERISRHAVRLLFTGAHSTGKTLLSRWLAALIGYAHVREAARDVFFQNGLNAYSWHDWDPAAQIALQREIWREQYTRNRATRYGVCDRGEIDSYVYGQLFFNREPKAQLFLAEMRMSAHASRRHYDQVFLVPPSIPLEDDGIRLVLPEHRQAVHNLLVGALHELEYPHYTLQSNTVIDRLTEVLTHLYSQVNPVQKRVKGG